MLLDPTDGMVRYYQWNGIWQGDETVGIAPFRGAVVIGLLAVGCISSIVSTLVASSRVGWAVRAMCAISLAAAATLVVVDCIRHHTRLYVAGQDERLWLANGLVYGPVICATSAALAVGLLACSGRKSAEHL